MAASKPTFQKNHRFVKNVNPVLTTPRTGKLGCILIRRYKMARCHQGMVQEVGLEPTKPFRAADLQSAAIATMRPLH